MVSAVLEYLITCPESLLACRLVNSQFKMLIDEMLEKVQWSLWNWSAGHGEGTPLASPGPIKRRAPLMKIFQDTSDIDQFLGAMADHMKEKKNPFPSRGIYIRRVVKHLAFPPEIVQMSQNLQDPERQSQTLQILMNSFRVLEQQSPCHIIRLPVFKVSNLLNAFGSHLSSVILECGVNCDFDSLEEFADLLEKLPNLKCLMLKGVKVPKSTETIRFPPLVHLKSLKIIFCTGITGALLSNYHNQLVNLQLLNARDYWFPHLELLQRENSGNIFIKLKDLKIGAFESPSEFDYFATFMKTQQEMQSLARLERVAIHYSMIHEFAKPSEKLFQVLEHLPRLKEFDVGKGIGTLFKIEAEDERYTLPRASTKHLVKISLPVQFIRHPALVRRILQGAHLLQKVKFVDCDKLIWHNTEEEAQNLHVEQALGLPKNITLDQILQEFLSTQECPDVSQISVVSCCRDVEQVVCTAINKKSC